MRRSSSQQSRVFSCPARLSSAAAHQAGPEMRSKPEATCPSWLPIVSLKTVNRLICPSNWKQCHSFLQTSKPLCLDKLFYIRCSVRSTSNLRLVQWSQQEPSLRCAGWYFGMSSHRDSQTFSEAPESCSRYLKPSMKVAWCNQLLLQRILICGLLSKSRNNLSWFSSWKIW